MKGKPNSLLRTSRILIVILSSPCALGNTTIGNLEDFIYLGYRIIDSESDIWVRKGRTWGACHTLVVRCVTVPRRTAKNWNCQLSHILKKLWDSKLRKSIKIQVFTALVESVLLYGSVTWTMTKRLGLELPGDPCKCTCTKNRWMLWEMENHQIIVHFQLTLYNYWTKKELTFYYSFLS